jgi:hypothetical protein
VDGPHDPVIRIPADLLDRAAARARETGAASLDVYVAALIERDVAAVPAPDAGQAAAGAAAAARREELLARLRSLGYAAGPATSNRP